MHQRLPVFASVVLSTTMVAAGAAVTVWDSAPMILAKCFAEVLVQYLRAENEVLDALAHGRVVVVTGGNR
ncbi:hypothetical protein HPB48_013007 [Haemaphysalis longicornis]|uniref:Uncharacterized protein n=1 Tax=Haemaphysalis longicornis TaxID=44386 RepID=A0A9J6FY55_HAELO|nr:hypothetical protein HPB48_013007 [Haemaphysalis longicornis]